MRALLPGSDRLYRPFIVTGLLLAGLVGFALGLHVALSRLFESGDPARTADLIRAHGQVQLLGFAGLYVMGISLRLLPRFIGARLGLEPLALPVLWLLTSALLVRSVFLPWFEGDVRLALLVVSSYGVLLASGGFFLIIAEALVGEARRPDPAGLAFGLGAGVLLLSSFVSTFALIDALGEGSHDLPLLTQNAVLQLQLLGFLLTFISGVALRALTTLAGVERPQTGSRLIPLSLALGAGLLAASLLALEYVSFETALVRSAGAAVLLIGLVLLGLVWQAGMLRPAANRVRPASQPHLWLVRSAFVWLILAALLLAYFGLRSLEQGQLPSQLDFDAVRHAIGLGVITPLIFGMSLMILPEFAVQRQQPNRQRQLALLLAALLNLAAILRVAPQLLGDQLSLDERNLSIAVAGSAAEVAILVFGVAVLRLVWKNRMKRSV